MFEKNSLFIKHLLFQPPFGLRSPHFQTVMPLFHKGGLEPPSTDLNIPLEDGDVLSGKKSTPPAWKEEEKTIILIHGLGGSDNSSYMIRMSRKLYQSGFQSIRINLRGAGLNGHLARRPYHAGTSQDILQTLLYLKREYPNSPIILIGYSLGGNIALKLVGELGESAKSLINHVVSICAPIDLNQTTQLLLKPSNYFYHRYYIRGLQRMGRRWLGERVLNSIIDFDHFVTAPQWGYRDAFDYYHHCSGKVFLSQVRVPCHLVFAEDDPFVNYKSVFDIALSPMVKIWLSRYGGHMGFWGWAGKEHQFCWLDHHLLSWIKSLD